MTFCAEESCFVLSVYSSTQRGRTDATVKSLKFWRKVVITFGGGILTIVILHNMYLSGFS